MIKTSLDFISELNSSSYSDLSDPDLTDTELEFVEKENFGKIHTSKSHPVSFSRSISLEVTKNNSIEDVPEELKIEYETEPLQTEAHVVSNTKGWHWISSIQGMWFIKSICLLTDFSTISGEGETTYDGITSAMAQLDGMLISWMKSNFSCISHL